MEHINEAPRPEAEVSGRPPRGGRAHGVSPLRGRGWETNLTAAPQPGLPTARVVAAAMGRGPSRTESEAVTGCTPDPWKLFGSHGQRPWLQEVGNDEVFEPSVFRLTTRGQRLYRPP